MNANNEQHGGGLKSWAIVILFSLVILGWGVGQFPSDQGPSARVGFRRAS